MKKKMNKEKQNDKKLRKQAERKKKKCATALEWSNIEMIEGNAITLKDGNSREQVIGIKIVPRNIFIDTNYVQARVINNLRIVFNKLRFPIYWQYVFVPVQIEEHITLLLQQEEQEEDLRIRAMIRNDFEKATWFQDTHRELEFFLMLRNNDENELLKNFDELVSEIKHAGFRTKNLNIHDFYNYVAYMYENPLINDFYFSRGVFSCLADGDNLEEEEDEYNEPEFSYDEYYESELKEDAYVE